MLSRVAENLYWMARYIERAENTARLVSVNAFLLLDLPRGLTPGWQPLIAITGCEADYEARHKEYDERSVVRFLVGDPNSTASILHALLMARENCRTVRDILPSAAWQQLTELVLFVREHLQSGLGKRGRHPYLKRIIESCQTLNGLLASTMLHDAAFQVLRVGRHLERADMTTRIIDVRSENLLPSETYELQLFENVQWMSVLKSLSAYQMYRRRMQTQVQRLEVLRFLFLDRELPRSVLYSLDAVEESLGSLSTGQAAPRAARSVARQLSKTRFEALDHAALHALIDELQGGLIFVHQAIAQTYFPPELEQSQSQTQG